MTDSPLRLIEDFPPLDRQTWRNAVERDLKGAPFEKRLITRLYEGLSVFPLYLDDDWPQAKEASGLPGQAPMTRGFQALPPAQGWTVIQRYADPDPARVAQLIRQETERGGEAVWLELTHGDAADARGIVIESLADLDVALSGVPLASIP